ncbi:unnamed protein product [Psylliodes chrysocephalus]|uniref:Protein NDNF n=1 Tax=Psylliodes chrysocephalus TaxID=3402493 RepID=A0A9P0GDF9_9CUCU|nr:unnamed protein product [Psylliodes chrysocephala]
MTCSSPVQWSFKINQNNSLDSFSMPWTVNDTSTLNFNSAKGLYRLNFISVTNDTYLHIYISTEVGGPLVLTETKSSKMYIHKRRKKIIVKWHPSLVDPQNTEYCLVIHNKKIYKTLCSAQLDKSGILSSNLNFKKSKVSSQLLTGQILGPQMSTKFGTDAYPIIACIGQKLQFAFSNPKMDETYYFSLFATNRQTNFTYQYGTISTNGRLKPITLKDGKAMFKNLKKMDGDALFRYKVPRNSDNTLKIFVASCDSKIKVKISKKEKVLLTKNVTKYSIISLNSVEVGTRYNVRIILNSQDIDNNSVIQILASSRKDFTLSFPLMPSDTRIREYESLKTCNSVTIGWYVPPQTQFQHYYCFLVKEGQILDIKEERGLNQCDIQRATRASDFVLQYCKYLDYRDQKVVVEKVRYLLPGKNYVFQVVVKKPQGKPLAYDLFQTHTLRTCSKFV